MPKLVINSVDRIRHESAHTVREMAAAYAFLDWEIEQGEKEERATRLADDHLMRGHKWENTYAKAGERDICKTCGLMRVWRGTFSDYYRNGRTTTDLDCTNQSES